MLRPPRISNAMFRTPGWFILLLFFASPAAAQEGKSNINQADQGDREVANSLLPDALVLEDGRRVRNAAMWYHRRRPEILRIFANNIYGRTPQGRVPVRYEVVSVDKNALEGKAIRKQVTVHFSAMKDGPKMDILLYVPANARKPMPVFLGLNFGGNQTVDSDPGIRLGEVWVRQPATKNSNLSTEPIKYFKQRAPESSRGAAAGQWQLEKIMARGYALATIYCGDIEPDFNGGMPYGVRPLFFKPGQSAPAPDEWGTLGAWAWGLSRAVDYLATDYDINAKKVALIGHSRLGKASLWAAAQDTRFAVVISNESGKGGASLYGRSSGETIEHLNTAFPHWFCTNFHQYSNHEDRVPVNGHMLLALIAPRPLYVASAEQDMYSDPHGEFLSAVAAGRVYELLGLQSLGTGTIPPLNQPIMKTIGYHIRAGKHDATAYDWDQYLDFADMHFGRPK